MFIEVKRIITQKGHADTIINKNSDTEEVIVEVRWQDKDAYTMWKKSDAHRSGHTGKTEHLESEENPIINVEINVYESI